MSSTTGSFLLPGAHEATPADSTNSSLTGATGGGTVNDKDAQYFKYPTNLGQPPFDKWIYFEAKSGRHVVRDQVVSETLGVDRTLSAVGLYLDATALKTSMQVHYETNDLGPFAGAAVEWGAQTGANLMGLAGSGTMTDYLKQNLKNVKEGAAAVAAVMLGKKGMDALFTDITQSFKGGAGATAFDFAANMKGSSAAHAGATFGAKPNPRTDVLFDAAQYRTYDMNFMLIPRSLQEAITIDRIVHFFQFYMLPIYGEAAIKGKVGGFMLGFPYEFEISLRDGVNNRLEHVNKFERCVLKDIVVDHAAGGKTAFVKVAGGPAFQGDFGGVAPDAAEFYPVATSIALTFQEVRLLDRHSDAIARQNAQSLPDPRT